MEFIAGNDLKEGEPCYLHDGKVYSLKEGEILGVLHDVYINKTACVAVYGVGMLIVRCFKNTGITRKDIGSTVILKNRKVLSVC